MTFTDLNTELVQNLCNINIFLQLWKQMFQENLGTRQIFLKLEGILTKL